MSTPPNQQTDSIFGSQLLALIEDAGRLLSSPYASDVLDRILELAGRLVQADAYAVWRRREGGVWNVVISSGLSDQYERTATERTEGFRLPAEPVAVEDVEHSEMLQNRSAFYKAEGIRSILMVPLNIRGEVAGSIVYYHRTPHRFTDTEVRVAGALGNLAGAAIGTSDLYEAQLELRSQAERAERQSSFLAHATAVLSSSLDYDTTLNRIAEAAVPEFADWCSLDVLERSGELRRVAVAHPDPAKVAFAHEFRRKYPLQDTHPLLVALRTQRPVWVAEITDEMVEKGARSKEHLDDVRALGVKSLIMAPMISRGGAVGVLTFVSAESERCYTQPDVAFAGELAARAATAIEHARLHADVSDREERLRLAQSAAGIGIWEWNIDANTSTWSPEIYQFLGIEEYSLRPCPETWIQYIHPEDREHAVGALQRSAREAVPLDTEFRIVRADGAVIWVLSRARVFSGPGGQATRMLGLNMDVTHRKQAEQTAAFLLRLEDSMRSLTEPEEIVNMAARLLGEHLRVSRCTYADVEADGETFNIVGNYTNGVPDVIGRYTIAQFGSEFARLSRENRPFVVADIESDPRTADAREAYRAIGIRALITVPLYKGDRLAAGIAVHQSAPREWRDDEIALVAQVTSRCWESIERTRVERELRESEGSFRQLADAVPAFVWITNTAGELVYFNSRWFDYTGLTPAECLGSGWLSTIAPEDLARVSAAWEAARDSEAPYEVECRYRNAAGVYRWFMARALPVRDESGRVTRWFGTSTDIHDAKRSEDALRSAIADLEQFAYSASHDLKEPLRMVAVYSQLLQRKYQGQLDQQADEYLGYTIQGARRMDMLVRDLLAYTQSVQIGDEQVTPANTRQVLDEALANLQAAIAQSRAAIRIGDLPEMLAVKDIHLLQLFQNLIGNAIKYSGEADPVVHISGQPDGAFWTFRVRDNGIGIAPKYTKQVFGLFKRLHADEKYAGTGIGLAICQKIVDRYGGRIWVESDGEGKGSTFFVTLPAGDPKPRTVTGEELSKST